MKVTQTIFLSRLLYLPNTSNYISNLVNTMHQYQLNVNYKRRQSKVPFCKFGAKKATFDCTVGSVMKCVVCLRMCMCACSGAVGGLSLPTNISAHCFLSFPSLNRQTDLWWKFKKKPAVLCYCGSGKQLVFKIFVNSRLNWEMVNKFTSIAPESDSCNINKMRSSKGCANNLFCLF